MPAVFWVLPVVLAAVSCCTSAEVVTLSKEALTAILKEPAVPNPWLVRFHLPFDPQDAAGRRAFAEASLRVPETVGRFGEFAVDSLDHFAIADGLQITNLPCISLVGSRIGRAIGASGAARSARLTSFMPEYRLNQTNAADIAMYLLANVPARYADRVTNTIVDSVHYVFSKKEIYAVSQQRQKDVSLGELTALPSKGLLFFLDLTNPSRKELVAAMSSVASQTAGSVIVCATADDDVAAQFKLTSIESAVSFPFPLPVDSSDKLELTPFTGLRTMQDIARVIREAAASSGDAVVEAQNNVLKSWAGNLRALQTTSPLRKLTTTDQFLRDIVEPKSSVNILFLLRESDDFFNSHFRTAVELASLLRHEQHTSALTKKKIANPFRFDVFWVDAEVHKSVAQVLKAKSVPSIAMIFSVVGQNGQPTKAAKWFEPPKKGEWPTALNVLQFITSEQVATNAGLFPFDPLTVTFASPSSSGDGKKKSSGGTVLAPDAPNNVYRQADFKTYPTNEEKENTFVNQLLSGAIKHEARKEEHDEKSSSAPLSAKKLEKKKKREEAEKAKLAAELEQKKKEKEERTRRKAEEDAVKREEMAAEAKRRAKEEKKKKKTQDKSSKGGAAKGENTYARPKFDPSKPPKDRHQQHEAWKAAMKEAVKRFVTLSGKPPKVSILRSLEIPAAATKVEGSATQQDQAPPKQPPQQAKKNNKRQEEQEEKKAPPKRAAPPAADDDGAISDE